MYSRLKVIRPKALTWFSEPSAFRASVRAPSLSPVLYRVIRPPTTISLATNPKRRATAMRQSKPSGSTSGSITLPIAAIQLSSPPYSTPYGMEARAHMATTPRRIMVPAFLTYMKARSQVCTPTDRTVGRR
ncbi:MAG: hypothetical protein A4E29_00012 [Methanomassiliicoccales archaeon PtaB.Bin134]|nr:MAG: hypothetical protein A4E29_00012 [Methanomassiliicoccales archaeon PtaB.Bin134]